MLTTGMLEANRIKNGGVYFIRIFSMTRVNDHVILFFLVEDKWSFGMDGVFSHTRWGFPLL